MSPEITQLQYLAPNDNNPPATLSYPTSNFSSIQNDLFLLHMSNSIANFPQVSSISNNSTSDEVEEQQLHDIVNDRKQRRMISNRESARRSRVRKQKQLVELFSQMFRLQADNQTLMEKLKLLVESHETLVKENALLKKEMKDIRRMLDELQLAN